ncbi:MAG: complex I NDUFA9 subunit family protein [Parvularculales bacterium]
MNRDPSLENRLITVFGGSGFIGRYVVGRLSKRGYRLRVAVRHPNRAPYLKPMGEVGQIDVVAADITNPASVEAALEGAWGCVNLVGILYETRRRTFNAIHHQAAASLAVCASRRGVRHFVHLSAIGADAESRSSYGRSKARGEQAVRESCPETVVVRPSVVFGPEDDFFNRFAAMALLAPGLPLIGGGHTRFQPVYVGDVAQAVCAAFEDEAAPGRIYELGGPEIYSFRSLMEMLLRMIGRRRMLVPVPFAVARLMGSFLQWLPSPPLTADQVALLEYDNIVSKEALAEDRTAQGLGITPTGLEVIVPTYLERFRTGGHFADRYKKS